jgi:hypothetical protein
MRADGDSVPAFAGWCVIGAAGCVSVLSMLTIGPFVLLATLILIGLMLWRVDFGWAMAGMISGACAPLLYVAWLNRGGPGEVCTTLGDSGQSCTQEWSPWPFLVLALLLAVAGVVVFVRQRRH